VQRWWCSYFGIIRLCRIAWASESDVGLFGALLSSALLPLPAAYCRGRRSGVIGRDGRGCIAESDKEQIGVSHHEMGLLDPPSKSLALLQCPVLVHH